MKGGDILSWLPANYLQKVFKQFHLFDLILYFLGSNVEYK